MAYEFELPDVGEGVAEGELVRWLVEPGDTVSEDQPLAEVETDKAMVEVPSPVDGTVKELRAEEGEMVPVGDVFVVLQPEGEVDEDELEESEREPATADEDADTGTPESVEAGGPSTDGQEGSVPEGRVFAAPSARRLARELGVDIAAVEGTGPSGRATQQDVRAHAEAAEGPAGDDTATAEAAAEGGADGTEPAGGAGGVEAAGETGSGPDIAGGGQQVESADRERTVAAPATRRVADELGVDIDAVPATEQRDGEAFVTEAAVRQYAQAQQEAQAAQAETAIQTAEGERVERAPYRGVRKTIGDAMAESKYSAPHVTHHETAVADELVEARGRLKEEAEERGFRLTYMPFVMKAVVAALKQHPVLNAELDEEAGEILKKKYYNIGVATATDAGLMVPVVEDVDDKGMLQISSEVNELVQKARDRSISREELQGSTFTITNFGAIGGEYATPILNYPEVAILGMGELKQRPVVEDGEVVAKWTLPLSISIDHRVVDGADVARFAETFIEYVENPELLLLE
ncbi:branched-chain alpha-keto acid dehydrogenase subunit E2 [Halobacteriales archaeon QS_1_68_20]|nr:MAG: branched-chain alpha-keto acid dehydrogenase subunit E2 [Halobacteriales archaeon QS_1_68_20]